MPTPPSMPGRTHHSAPKFDGTPSLLANFFDEIEQLAEICELTDKQTISWAIRYAPTEESDLWKEVSSATGTLWTAFKDDIYELYPGSTGDRKYTLVNLEAITDAQVKEAMESSTQFGAYYRSFTQVSNFLKKRGRLSDREISGRFINGLDTVFRSKVRAQLYAENPTHHTDDPYELSSIRKAALFVLSCNNGDINPAPSTLAQPTVKREQIDMTKLGGGINYTLLAQEMAKVMGTAQPVQPGGRPAQTFNSYASNVTRTNECIFCSETTHYLNRCPKAAEYITKGRCTRNIDNQIALPNGERLNARTHPGRNLQERIDNWHLNNPSTAPLATHMLTVDEINYLEKDTANIEPTSQFTWSQYIEEDDEVYRGYATNEDEELLQTLLNNTQKKLEDIRKKNGKGNGPTTRSAAKNQPLTHSKDDGEQRRSQQDLERNKDTINPTMAEAATAGAIESAKPISQTGKPFQSSQYRYTTPIESQEAINRIMENTLNAKTEVSIRDLMAVSMDVRKNIKELVTTKKVPVGVNNLTGIQSSLNIQSLLASLPERTDGIVVSNHSEKLRAIEVKVDDRLMVEAIMDEGSQIVAIRKDIWEKLGLAVRCDHLVTMESANSSVNTSVGLLQDLKLTINGYDFYIQVQVIENAPYEILLGLPFHVLTELATKFYKDGSSHITIKDPNSGAIITVPTRERKREATKQGAEDKGVLLTGF